MKKLNKKEVKALKRDVARYGADYQGYYYGIEEVINYSDMVEVFNRTDELGFNFGNASDSERLSFTVTVLAEVLSYQEFKKLVPYFLGYSSYKLVKGSLIEVVEF